MTVAENLTQLKSLLPSGVKLIAVSKNHTTDRIFEAYRSGHRVFGENKAQELISKQPLLPNDIEWHFIGHLQTNKVKNILAFVKLIHSVESFKLIKEINKEAHKKNITANVLFQFHIASEESKYGFNFEEAHSILSSEEFKSMNNISICGVMGMATFTEETHIIRQEFKHLKVIYDKLKEEFFSNNDNFKEISMGMSDDYLIGIEEGSTMIRIGTAIFGQRK